MEKSALETDRPGRVVLCGLLDLRPTLPLERIAMAIDEAVARALAASGYGLGTDALTGQHGLIGRLAHRCATGQPRSELPSSDT
jgi:hypothetical protein